MQVRFRPKKLNKKTIFLIIALGVSIYLSPNSTPDYPILFYMKRAQEKIFINFKVTKQSKYNYYHHLLDNRLIELDYIVKYRAFNFMLESSLRYSTTAGLLTEYLVVNNLTEFIPQTVALFTNHQQKLHQLINDYPQEINTEWKYLTDDINYLDIYLSQLRELER